MGEINVRVCTPWATLEDLELAPGFNPDSKIEPSILGESLTVATDILYELSGHKEPGLCTKTVRPASRNCFGALLGFGWSSNYPSSYGPGDWYQGWGSCGCSAGSYEGCSCAGIDSIRLGAYPLVSIQSVKVNGVAFSPSVYRIDDYKYLVRTDGGSWPTRQDLSKASTQPDTFEVAFTYGHSISTGAKWAACRLGLELAKARANDKSCKLPERVQAVTRQGVTVAFIDVFAFFKEHRTGIYEVDLWLNSVNPYGRTASAAILSPDVTPSSRQINT